MNPLLILDRDGVINQDSEHYIKSLTEWISLPGSIEAIGRLSRAGFAVAVATNQSGLARGLFDRAELDAMHQHLTDLITAAGGKLLGIYVCPHGPDQQCDCRKPKPGLIHQITHASGFSAEGAFIVGDSRRDLEAGLACGCQPVLVRTGKGEQTLTQTLPPGTSVHADLSAFADWLLDGGFTWNN